MLLGHVRRAPGGDVYCGALGTKGPDDVGDGALKIPREAPASCSGFSEVRLHDAQGYQAISDTTHRLCVFLEKERAMVPLLVDLCWKLIEVSLTLLVA